MTTENKQSLLLYDGACPMCQRARQWVEKHVPPHAIKTLPCQDKERPLLAPMISTENCMSAMQLITANGEVFSGERAFPHILRHTHYGRYFGWAFYLPGAGLLYRAVARNRLAISGLLLRKQPGEHCSIDKGCE